MREIYTLQFAAEETHCSREERSIDYVDCLFRQAISRSLIPLSYPNNNSLFLAFDCDTVALAFNKTAVINTSHLYGYTFDDTKQPLHAPVKGLTAKL